MPEIVLANPGTTLANALNAASTTAGAAYELVERQREIQKEREREELRNQKLRMEIAEAERAEAQANLLEQQRKIQQGAEQAFLRARRGLAEQDFLQAVPQEEQDPMQKRLNRFRGVAERLSPESQEKYIQMLREREQRNILEQGYQREAQELQDAVADGLFEGNEDTATKMAEALEKSYRSGQMPGDVSERLEMLRDKKAEADVRLQRWEETFQKAQQMLEFVDSKNLELELRKRLAKAQAPSFQKRNEPDAFLLELQQLMRNEERGAFQEMERAPVEQRQTQIRQAVQRAAPVVQEGSPQRRAHEEAQAAERQRRFGDRIGSRDEEALGPQRAAGAPTDVTDVENIRALIPESARPKGGGAAGADFGKIPKGRQRRVLAGILQAMREGGPGSVPGILSELDLDISTLPEWAIRQLVLPEDVDKVMGRGASNGSSD